jgi:acetolactate synthase regulatory subunit
MRFKIDIDLDQEQFLKLVRVARRRGFVAPKDKLWKKRDLLRAISSRAQELLTTEATETWICRDGRVVLISEMEDRHLAACINKIKRMTDWRRSYLPRLEEELMRRFMKGTV